MESRRKSISSKLVGLAAALGLTFAMACATTSEDDVIISDSNQAGAGQTADPLGPPQHIESEITREHPSSNTGAGNAQGSGANTNLNRPQAEPAVTVTQSDAAVIQTPIVEERTVIVETEPEPVVVEVEPVRTAQVVEVEEDEDEVVIRRVTRKE